MPTQPLSVQLYSVRDAVAADLPGALARVAGIGFTNVELYGFVDRADEYARALADAGLSAPSGHAPVLQYDDPRPAFEAARTVGVRTLIDPHHPAEHWRSADDIRAAAERMNAVAVAAAEFDLTFGYHNHWFELEAHHDGVTGLELLEQHLDPAVVLEVDTFWVTVVHPREGRPHQPRHLDPAARRTGGHGRARRAGGGPAGDARARVRRLRG